MYLKRNRASSDNMRVICSSKKAKNTYEVHTQRATSVITQSFYSEFSFFPRLSAVIMTRCSDCCEYSTVATTQNQKQIEAPYAAKNQMFSPNRSYYMKKNSEQSKDRRHDPNACGPNFLKQSRHGPMSH